MSRAALFRVIERYAKVIQNLTIILGIAVGVLSLLAAQYEKRVSKTVEFSKLYNEGVRKDYLSLRSRWDERWKKFPNFSKLDKQKRKDLIVAFFDESSTDNGKPSNHDLLTNILDFFDVLSVCVTHRSCDRNSTIDFFAPSGDFVFDIAGEYVLARRARDPDPQFGIGLEKFWRLSRECFLSRYL